MQNTLCQKLEYSLVELQVEIEKITTPLLTFGSEQFHEQVEKQVTGFLVWLEDVVGTLRRALLFMLMKVL